MFDVKLHAHSRGLGALADHGNLAAMLCLYVLNMRHPEKQITICEEPAKKKSLAPEASENIR
jgi:hypothetical protein